MTPLTLETAFDDPQKRGEYERTLDALWRECIVESHECLKDARTILNSDVGWLLVPGPGHVLLHVARVYLERAALKTINVLTDPREEALTLAFVRRLLLTTCSSQARDELHAAVKNGFRQNRYNHLRQRARDLRNKGLAHIDTEYLLDPPLRQTILLGVAELEELLDKAKALLQVLSPGLGRGFDLITFSPDHGMPYVVRQLMKDSTLLNMPEEQHPLVFPEFARKFSDEQKAIYDRWRKEIGNAEIDFDQLQRGAPIGPEG